MDVLGARQGEVRFRGAVKYPGDRRHFPVYLSWPLARLSVDHVGLVLAPSWRLLGVLLRERRWPWSAILTVQALRRGVKIVTRDLGEGAPIVFLADPLPGLIRMTPRLLDTLQRFNAPLDRGVHRRGWFSLPVYPSEKDSSKTVRRLAWVGWIVAIPLIILGWLTYLHPDLLPVLIAVVAATAMVMSALVLIARRR